MWEIILILFGLLCPLYYFAYIVWKKITYYSAIFEQRAGRKWHVPDVPDEVLSSLIQQYNPKYHVWEKCSRKKLEDDYLREKIKYERVRMRTRLTRVMEYVASMHIPGAPRIDTERLKNMAPQIDEALILAASGDYSGMFVLVMDLL